MKIKRVYHPIDKDMIAKAISHYKAFVEAQRINDRRKAEVEWDMYYQCYQLICPGSNTWASALFQSMEWSGTLDVEHVYQTILASGINTTLEEEVC